ncbi:hypothetical protein SSVK1p02 [Sulfolobus virus Kamchatka 1]|uniref:ORF A82 n=1 Tax=Sulfolobus virus Kamchatka 1 TaxID=248496 RepID=Q6TDN4_9VIRU|nr:hypothetical protein SSVK1p02 [Sulfolobus virus Kamchatka 1]AAQ94365.1 ORF A82 [Sulfolobus virus Kamchatka 1]
MMRWMSNGLVSPKNIRRNSPRFRFNYAHYCFTIQKVKAQERETNIKPQIHRVLSHRGFGISLTRRALCLLHHLRNLFYGIID